MKKRLFILICGALLLLPGIFAAAAGTGIVSGSGSEAESGGTYEFTVDLGSVAQSEAAYTVTVSVSPAVTSLTVGEGVAMSYNSVQNAYEISSDGLTGISALHFTATLPETAVAGDSYTVTTQIVGADAVVTSGSLSFTVKGAETEQEAPTGTPENTEASALPQSGTAPAGATAASGGATATATDNTLTYQGSYNNYLSSLSVSDYEFHSPFDKTNDTYFITVANDVTAVTVSATADDSSATVAVTGNEELAVGLNKVLISITADNGEVRTYRIYVTREDAA